MNEIARFFVVIGIIFLGLGILIGIAARLGGSSPWIGHLPGDIIIRKDHFSFTFPITTCLVLSLIISLLIFFVGRK